MPKTPQIWAHRGASYAAPENTMEAFRLAHQEGADGIELDVQLSKDGKVVVIHDERLERTTDGTGWVKDYDYKELLCFNAHNNMKQYRGAKIPLLREVLAYCKETGMFINIELKTGLIRYDGIENAVYKEIRKANMIDQVLISSFNHFSVIALQQLNPKLQTGFISNNAMLNIQDYLDKYGVDAYHPSINALKIHLYEENISKQYPEIKIHVWGLQTTEQVYTCIKNNVDAIITNFPGRDRKIIKQQQQ